MSSMFTSLFNRDPTASFTFLVDGEIVCSTSDGVTLRSSRRKTAPRDECTLHTATESTAVHLLKTSAGKLRTMRHPNILTYVDALDTESTSYLVTESCSTVEMYMRETEMTDEQREHLVTWGVYQLFSALKFLHDEAKLAHNRLRRGVFITRAGDWKLGVMCDVAAYKTAKDDLLDVYHIVWDVFNNGYDVPVDSTLRKKPARIPKRLHTLCMRIVKEASRTSASLLLDVARGQGGVLNNKLVHMLLFVDEYELKEAREKASFFASLNDQLDVLPSSVAMYKVLPKLIQAYEFGDVGVSVVTALLSMSKALPEEEYQERIVPCVCRLFASPDRAIRVKLLAKLGDIVHHLGDKIVNESIFGNVCSGFMDTNPSMREATVKAMVTLVPKLNANNLNVELMRHFARLQGKDDQASIRTNTTICLGKIGHHLAPASRQKILISAFTRATRDSFPAARMAAVLSLTATQQYYQLSNVAQQILPSLAPLTVDTDKQVRNEAFKSMRGFLAKLEAASDDPESIAELESSVNSSTAPHSDKVPQWASWAMGALGGKFYKTTTAKETTPTPSIAGNRETSQEPEREEIPPSYPAALRNDQNTPPNGWGEAEEDDADWTTDFASPSVSMDTKSTALQIGAKPKGKPRVTHERDLTDDLLADEFGAVTTATSPTSMTGGGWDDDGGWGEEPVIAPVKPAASARSAARKAEMVAKRAAKKTGTAMKLGGSRAVPKFD